MTIRTAHLPFTPEQSCQPKHSLAESITGYLREIGDHKSKKTCAAYSLTLRLFKASCASQNLEDLTRRDLLNFASRLKQRGNSPRTVRNRIDYFQIFLHHFGLPSLLQGKDLPKYTQKKVRAYSSLDLDKMFRHANQDECKSQCVWQISTGGVQMSSLIQGPQSRFREIMR